MTTLENNAEKSLSKAIAAIKSEYGCTHDTDTDSQNDKLGESEEKEKMANMIIKKFQASFDIPPIAEIEYLIRKPFTLSEVRVMLFSPLENQIFYYVTILNETNSNSTSNDFIKVRNLILSLIFLIHRKVWSFLSDFILAGGLHAIAGYMASDNLYIRGQVLEIFLSTTDCDIFDWFQPHENDYRKSELHRAMLSLSSNKSFLQNLLLNRVSSYPGGSFRSLQILAFWLSWVRAMYTENQQLHLSKALFSELKSWYIDTTLVVQDGMGGDGPQSIEKPDEEITLAKTLYEDFFNSQQQQSEKSSMADSSDLFVTGFSTASLAHAPTASSPQAPIEEPSTLSIQSVSAMKEKGNVEFRAKQYSEALTCYSNAIDDLLVLKDSSDVVAFPPTSSTAVGGSLSLSDGHELTTLEISLHMNAATALWHLATDAATTSAHQGGDFIAALLERCAEHSRTVLKADPMQLKGLYRLVHVMLWQGNAVDALEVVTSALQLQSHNSSTTDDDVTGASTNASNLKDLLGKLRLKCLAAIIVEDHNADNSADTTQVRSRVTALLPAKSLKVLNSILSRNQSKVRVNVPVYDAPTKSAVLKTNSTKSSSCIEGDILQAATGISKVQINSTKGLKSDGGKKGSSLLPLPPKSDHHRAPPAVVTATTTTTTTTTTSSKEKSKSKPSAAVTVAFARLKQLSVEYEKVKNRNNGAIVDPVLQAEQLKILESSTEPLSVIQSEGFSMKKLFLCSLEECHLLYLLSAGNHLSADHLALFSQLFSELKDCERFQTVLTLSIMDDGKLKENTIHTLQYLLSSVQNSLSTKLRKGLENFLQILSAN